MRANEQPSAEQLLRFGAMCAERFQKMEVDKKELTSYMNSSTESGKLMLQALRGELLTLEQAKMMLNGHEALPIVRPEIGVEYLIAKETDALSNFFGRDIDMSFYRQTLEGLKPEQIRHWSSLGLGIHFLPRMTLKRDMELPGWKIKPDEFYWGQLEAGNFYNLVGNDLVKVEVAQLLGQVLLIDHRLKPRYRDGKQRWEDDKAYLGAIMAKLRKEQAIESYQYGPQTSRFGVSSNGVEGHVRAAAADLLGLNVDQVTLEPTLVANMIPQIHADMARSKDGTTNTWGWYNEYFKSAASRVIGGRSGHGGLADVIWDRATGGDLSCSFRLQGVLASQVVGT